MEQEKEKAASLSTTLEASTLSVKKLEERTTFAHISNIHPLYLATNKWTVDCVQCRNDYHNSSLVKTIFEYVSI